MILILFFIVIAGISPSISLSAYLFVIIDLLSCFLSCDFTCIFIYLSIYVLVHTYGGGMNARVYIFIIYSISFVLGMERKTES